MIDFGVQMGCASVILLAALYLWKTEAGVYASLIGLLFAAQIVLYNLWFLFHGDPEGITYGAYLEGLRDPDKVQYAIYLMGLMGIIVLDWCVIFRMFLYPPLQKDLIVIMLSSIVLLSNAYSALFENLLCNVIVGDQDGASEFICGRIFGEDFTSLPLVILTTIFAWLALKWKHPKIKTLLRQ